MVYIMYFGLFLSADFFPLDLFHECKFVFQIDDVNDFISHLLFKFF